MWQVLPSRVEADEPMPFGIALAQPAGCQVALQVLRQRIDSEAKRHHLLLPQHVRRSSANPQTDVGLALGEVCHPVVARQLDVDIQLRAPELDQLLRRESGQPSGPTP
jgi:hypothetical protein